MNKLELGSAAHFEINQRALSLDDAATLQLARDVFDTLSALHRKEENARKVISTLYEKGMKVSLVASGAGIGVFDLFKVPGCSSVMTEGTFLYDSESYKRFFDGDVPDASYVSEVMATAMGRRLQKLRPDNINVAITAAVKTNRERRGKDHAHIHLFGPDIDYHVYFVIKGDTREEQDDYLTQRVFEAILFVADL